MSIEKNRDTMDAEYKIVWTRLFLQDYAHEYEYSVTHWGHEHAALFFEELDHKIANLSLNPHWNKRQPEMPEHTRYFTHKNGIHIIFEIDEKEKEVRLLGVLGKNRFHEIAQEAAKKRHRDDE